MATSGQQRVYFHVHGLPTVYKLKINSDSQLKHLFRHVPTHRYTPASASGPPVFSYEASADGKTVELDSTMTPSDYRMPTGEGNANRVTVHFPTSNEDNRSPLVPKGSDFGMKHHASQHGESAPPAAAAGGDSLRDVRGEEGKKERSLSPPGARRYRTQGPAADGYEDESLRVAARHTKRSPPRDSADGYRGDDIEQVSSIIGQPGSPQRDRVQVSGNGVGMCNLPLEDSSSGHHHHRSPPREESSYTRQSEPQSRSYQQRRETSSVNNTSNSVDPANSDNVEVLQARVRSLSGDLRQERKDNVAMQQEVERLEDHKALLEQQAKRLRIEAREGNESYERLADARHGIDKLQAENNQLEAKYEGLLVRSERQKRELDLAKQKQLQAETELMEEQLQVNNRQADSRMEEVRVLKFELSKLESNFAEKAGAYERQLEARDELVRTAKGESRQALERCEAAEAALRPSQAKSQEHEKQIAYLGKEVDSLQDQNMALINDSAIASQNVIKSQAELRGANSKVLLLTAEVDKLEARLKALSASQDKPSDQDAQLKRQTDRVDNLLSEKHSLEDINRRLQEDLENLQKHQASERSSSHTNVAAAGAEKVKVQDELEDLKKDYDILMQQCEAKDLALQVEVRGRQQAEDDAASCMNQLNTSREGVKFLESVVSEETYKRKECEKCLEECNAVMGELQGQNAVLQRRLGQMQPGSTPPPSNGRRFTPPAETPQHPSFNQHQQQQVLDQLEYSHNRPPQSHTPNRAHSYGGNSQPSTPAHGQRTQQYDQQQQQQQYQNEGHHAHRDPQQAGMPLHHHAPPSRGGSTGAGEIGVRDVTVVSYGPSGNHHQQQHHQQRSGGGQHGHSEPSSRADQPPPPPGLNRSAPVDRHSQGGQHGYRSGSTNSRQGYSSDGSSGPPPVRSLR